MSAPASASRRAVAAAVIASGAFGFASTGVFHVWPLAWVAPLPLLLVLPGLRVRWAALAGFSAAGLAALNLVWAYRGALPPAVLALGVVLLSLPAAAVAAAWSAVARRAGPAVAVLAYPAFAVAVEFLLALGSPHGSFGSLAYSQADVLPVIQLVSVTGLPGVSFLVALVPAALAVAWRRRDEPGAARRALLLAAVPLAAVLAFGFARLAAPARGEQIRLGLAAADGDVPHFADRDAARALPAARAWAARAAALADRGAEVVVLPEKAVGLTTDYAAEAYAAFSEAAAAGRTTIVAGFNHAAESDRRNLAAVFAPGGSVATVYDKIHPVPGLEEGYRRGTEIGLLPATSPLLGVAICKDLDFVPLGRAHARAGTALLLVPAWDFVRDGWIHSRMAILRGVEGGFAVARTAAEGRLTVSDAFGRVVAEADSGGGPEVLLNATVAVAPGGTIYSRTGDGFAWLAVAGALACGWVAFRRRQPEPG